MNENKQKFDFWEFKAMMETEVLEFSKPWTIEQWHDAYIIFKRHIKEWKEDYLNKMTTEQVIIEWGREFYQGSDRNTHNYWVVKKDNGWYYAETSKPEYNKAVLVLIPNEDNHITSGMWDISKKWILLDEYREITGQQTEEDIKNDLPASKVTHYRPLPELPESMLNRCRECSKIIKQEDGDFCDGTCEREFNRN